MSSNFNNCKWIKINDIIHDDLLIPSHMFCFLCYYQIKYTFFLVFFRERYNGHDIEERGCCIGGDEKNVGQPHVSWDSIVERAEGFVKGNIKIYFIRRGVGKDVYCFEDQWGSQGEDLRIRKRIVKAAKVGVILKNSWEHNWRYHWGYQ